MGGKGIGLILVVIFMALFCYPLAAFSQVGSIPPVIAAPSQTEAVKDNLFNPEKSSLKEKKTGRTIFDFSTELLTSVHGEQTFDVIDSDEFLISRLKYPHRGQAMVFKGELYALPRLSIGGRFSSSSVLQLSNANCTDTDWKTATGGQVWTESTDSTKTELTFFDFNLYARALNLEKTKGIGAGSKLSLDIFSGYQYQKARYGQFDLTSTVDNYIPENEKASGHNSFYKIKYRGPRLGARGEYSYNRFSTRFSFAYAWLAAKAGGYWNLREYPFRQDSDSYDGYGLDLNTEFAYQFTKNLSAGFGYNYMIRRQHKMKESGDDATDSGRYTDYDIIRNANSTLYGPSIFLRVNW